MNTKNNRQYKGSAQKMEEAMIVLMNQVPFEKITVKMICENAKVNRSTFYAHYIDIFDMIEQMENHLRKELMKNYPIPGHVKPLSISSFIPFLSFIKEHKDFYQIALKNRKEFPIKEGFDAIWTEVVIPCSLKAGLTNEKEMMFYWIGFQAGLTMIIKYWLDTGCIENEEHVANIIYNCIPSVWKK